MGLLSDPPNAGIGKNEQKSTPWISIHGWTRIDQLTVVHQPPTNKFGETQNTRTVIIQSSDHAVCITALEKFALCLGHTQLGLFRSLWLRAAVFWTLPRS